MPPPVVQAISILEGDLRNRGNRGLGTGPAGASVYSASEVARNEFPDEDITVRGAVSIGRRLMDPLAELVKIDPKAIGVGQYQHDVDQKALKERLDDVAGSCVNNVGVELNTASGELLSYVSGLGPRLAKAIVEHRNSYGPFASRESLKKVPRLGPKAFEGAPIHWTPAPCIPSPTGWWRPSPTTWAIRWTKWWATPAYPVGLIPSAT